jgi:hypothetical protein
MYGFVREDLDDCSLGNGSPDATNQHPANHSGSSKNNLLKNEAEMGIEKESWIGEWNEPKKNNLSNAIPRLHEHSVARRHTL